MKSTTFEVDGFTYDFDALPALEAMQLLGRVHAICGDGLKDVSGGDDGGPGLLVATIGGLMSNLGDPRVIDIIKVFAGRCRVHTPDGTDREELKKNNFATFDLHFECRVVAMSKWFFECFAFQFADFLDLAKNTVLLKLVALEQAFLSQVQSTGSSGESSPQPASPTPSSPSSESGA